MDVPSIDYPVHDFTSPHVELYLAAHARIVQKTDIVLVDENVLLAIYWTECDTDPINPKIYELTGMMFRGEAVVFRRRKDGMRFVNLRKGDDEKALRAMVWSVFAPRCWEAGWY